MTDERDEFTEWLDEQSVERIQAAYDRVAHRLPEGDEDPEFEAALMAEVYSMNVADVARKLVDEGIATIHVTDDGDLGYTLTEDGRAYAEDVIDAS